MEQVTIGVHECLNQPGCYLIKISTNDGQRVVKWYVGRNRKEADKLAKSVYAYLEIGLPLSALLPDDDDPDQPVEEAST